MQKQTIKYSVIGVVVLLIGVIIFLLSTDKDDIYTAPIETVQDDVNVAERVIGKSVEGRDIKAFTYGNGDNNILFVGGIHGGYEWNSTYLAYRMIDHIAENLGMISDGMSVSIIPSANPDGLFKIVGKEGRFTVDDAPDSVTGPGRFNANDVDLNRNFDCKWQPESTWRGAVVSAGTSAFSEPESRAIRDFVLETNPKAVVFWHSQANAVYASECQEGILPVTLDIMNIYANASGYTPVSSFDAYEVTGDAEGWLASIEIPAITVELKTHETIEWEGNLAGVLGVLKYFGK